MTDLEKLEEEWDYVNNQMHSASFDDVYEYWEKELARINEEIKALQAAGY